MIGLDCWRGSGVLSRKCWLDRLLVESWPAIGRTVGTVGKSLSPSARPTGKHAVLSDRESGHPHFESSRIPPILPDKALNLRAERGFAIRSNTAQFRTARSQTGEFQSQFRSQLRSQCFGHVLQVESELR